MGTWGKRIAWLVAGLALLLGAAVFAGSTMAGRKMSRVVYLEVAPVEVRNDAAHIEQGRYLFATRGCAECHGADGAGKVFIDNGSMKVVGPNLTAGLQSVTRNYQPVDFVRTVRHGVKPNGTPVIIMPSEDYARLTDDDMSSLIAFIQQLPQVDGQAAQVKLPLIVRLLYAAGQVKDAAERIDHNLPPAQPVPVAVSREHGAYVAQACIGCHGDKFSGGKIPGAPPDWPAAANLTPGKGSAMARYPDAAAFKAMLRSGVRGDGSKISVMPFASFGKMNDTDVAALHAYLQTLPARDAGLH